MVASNIILVQFFILINGVFSNIVDTKFPIVIHDSSGLGQELSGNSGRQSNGYSSDNNYFGYSVAFMKGYLSGGGSSGAVYFEGSGDATSTLFIGAPNETKSAKNAGVVWQCRFDGRDSKVSCSIYRLLSELNSPVDDPNCSGQSQKRYKFPEEQTEQWIGASLSVNPVSRQFLACAPRWKMNGFWTNKNKYNCQMKETAMPGACFVASQESVIHELSPLNKPEDYYYPDRGLSGYYKLYSEFGFSSHFTDSGNLIVGAPCTRSWMGAMVEVNEIKPGKDNVLILTDISGIGRNSFLGYTVTSGLARTRGYYIASGAPRANGLYGSVTVSYPRHRPFAIYSGEQFGSYFGYALATVDLNGDGFDELLVGAPWHTQEFSSSNSYDTGCVLIFDLQLRSRKAIEKLCMDTQLISKGSRFGSAITKIRDLNFDQQDDFAISAPYDDNGQGTIYIYHGGFPLSKNPAQVIRGRYLNIPNLHGFGTYLLCGNQVDIDGNTTPDLVIGAFESHHVVVLRTRPVARVSMKISFHTGESQGHDGQINKYLPTQRSFRARTCVSFKYSISLPQEQKFVLETWLSFELGQRLKQVQFENPDDQQEHLNSLSPFQETCVDTGLRVDGEIDTSNSNDFIQFRARLKYNQTETSENQLVEHASVTLSSSPNQQNRNQYSQAYNAFNEYLPIPIPPMNSEWGLLSVAPDNCDADGKLWCDAELSLQLKVYEVDPKTQQHKELAAGKPLVVGQLESLLIKVDIFNLKGKETAYNPILWVTVGVSENFNMYPKYLTTSWKMRRCTNLDAPSDHVNGVTAAYFGQRCPLVIQPGSQLTLTMESGNWGHLRVSNSTNGDRGFLNLKVEAFPELNLTQRVEKLLQMPLNADVAIDVKASVPAEQVEIDPTILRTKLVDIGQYYIIVNKGLSGTTMEAVTAEILVPTRVNLRGNNWTEVIGVADPSTSSIRCTAEKFTFFVLPPQAVVVGQQNSSFSDNPNEKKGGTYSSKRRTTRSTKSIKVSPEKVSVTESSDKYITLSGCEEVGKVPEGKTCQKIICKMDLSSKETSPKEIKLQMYVLQNALDGLVKAETKGIRVTSVISVFYQGKKVYQQSGITQRNFQLEKGISALILLGAGAGGTILFILITFALFKCGFFRRKTKEQLIQLKRQTMQMNAQDLNQLQESLQAMEQEDEQQNVYL